jgi:hypothetical protein
VRSLVSAYEPLVCSAVVFEASFRVSAPSFVSPHDSELFCLFSGYADWKVIPFRTEGSAGNVGPDAVVQRLSMAVGEPRSVEYA